MKMRNLLKFAAVLLLLAPCAYGQEKSKLEGFRTKLIPGHGFPQIVNPGGGSGSGTVTVVGSGSLTSTALVTGGGTTTIQTPSATSTLDSSGNLVLAGSLTAGGALAAGSSCTPMGASAHGGMCAGENASTGWTPTSGFDYFRADSTAHKFVISANGGTEYPVAVIIASGSTAMGTSSIASGNCATVVTVSATGVLTSDTITYTPAADPTGVTGYAVSATGSLYIWAYPTANNVNFKVCNNTSGALVPSALTINWQVRR